MNEEMADKVNIIGTGISNISLAETIGTFNGWIDKNEKKRVCITPVNCLLWAKDNEQLRQIYNSADLTLCDGVPLLWAARMLRTPLKERVTGLDLLPRYIKECYLRNYSMFFMGAGEGVADALKKKCEDLYPGIRVKGTYSPPFANRFSDAENAKICSMINQAAPDVLWVSLTAPKQDFWIYEQLKNLNVHIAIGVGGAFEVTLGSIQRAPVFMQKAGLEWLYRLIKEPRRLYKRYLLEAPRFIPLLIKQKLKKKG